MEHEWNLKFAQNKISLPEAFMNKKEIIKDGILFELVGYDFYTSQCHCLHLPITLSSYFKTFDDRKICIFEQIVLNTLPL
jgi:hypothetical protein